MVNKQPEVTEQTRARLKASFWNLYLQRDVGKIRVKDITDAAGYNRATFYQYYRDIPDLFAQAEDELLDKIAELISNRLLDLVSGDFESDMEFLASTVQTYRTVMSVLLSERGDPKFVRKFKDLIVPLINQGADYLNLSEPQTRLFREFSLAGIVAAVSAWLSDDSGMSVSDFVMFLSASCAPQKCGSREEFAEKWEVKEPGGGGGAVEPAV
jgi:AcrR family transcriptional regulator